MAKSSTYTVECIPDMAKLMRQREKLLRQQSRYDLRPLRCRIARRDIVEEEAEYLRLLMGRADIIPIMQNLTASLLPPSQPQQPSLSVALPWQSIFKPRHTICGCPEEYTWELIPSYSANFYLKLDKSTCLSKFIFSRDLHTDLNKCVNEAVATIQCELSPGYWEIPKALLAVYLWHKPECYLVKTRYVIPNIPILLHSMHDMCACGQHPTDLCIQCIEHVFFQDINKTYLCKTRRTQITTCIIAQPEFESWYRSDVSSDTHRKIKSGNMVYMSKESEPVWYTKEQCGNGVLVKFCAVEGALCDAQYFCKHCKIPANDQMWLCISCCTFINQFQQST